MNEHTSRELSERLDEKGFRAEHECDWIFYDGHWSLDYSGVSLYDGCESYPAYTFSELWTVVPHDIIITKQSGGIYCGNRFTVITCRGKQLIDLKSPAEAMGLLVEWLLDNSYIEREG